MRDEEQINPGHGELRLAMRVIGPAMIGVGGIFVAIGMISFFSAFGGNGPPQYFWCCFVGAPIATLGIGLTKFAYMGAVYRYLAGEVAPVQKDTFNYLATGIGPGVKDLAQAVGEGLQAGRQGASTAGSTESKYCSKCGQSVPPQANFCSSCGEKLV